MSDPIERQVAIDACHNWDDGKDAYAFGHVIVERIQKLPSAQRWIPVSESLPEEGKQVLVCDDGGFIYTAEGETRSDGEWQWYESAEYRPVDDVMAWMPLPEPWKGEER